VQRVSTGTSFNSKETEDTNNGEGYNDSQHIINAQHDINPTIDLTTVDDGDNKMDGKPKATPATNNYSQKYSNQNTG
jgi:hypothetical protein